MVDAYAASLAGRESLHATVLAGRPGVTAFLGPSGEGKSTLAASMLSDGWRLVTDDILYPTLRGGRTWPLARRTWLKSAPSRGGVPPKGAQFDPNLGKYILRLNPPAHHRPISAFIRLHRRRTGSVRIRRLSPTEAALQLVANVYNEILRPSRVLRRQFEWATRLAAATPVWSLTYPTGKHHLPKVVRSVERILRI